MRARPAAACFGCTPSAWQGSYVLRFSAVRMGNTSADVYQTSPTSLPAPCPPPRGCCCGISPASTSMDDGAGHVGAVVEKPKGSPPLRSLVSGLTEPPDSALACQTSASLRRESHNHQKLSRLYCMSLTCFSNSSIAFSVNVVVRGTPAKSG